ncbi:unnamed protein product, partial [Didymodactylos carnosus]
ILETTQDGHDQKEDLNKLKTMLLNSNYPLKEIENLIRQACEELKSNTSNNSNNNNKISINLMLYINQLKHDKWLLESPIKTGAYGKEKNESSLSDDDEDDDQSGDEINRNPSNFVT